MNAKMFSRRDVLFATVAIGGAGLALAPTAAQAFRIDTVESKSKLGMALNNRCGGPAEHDNIKAMLESQLASDGSQTSASATCPICGCPVTVWR